MILLPHFDSEIKIPCYVVKTHGVTWQEPCLAIQHEIGNAHLGGGLYKGLTLAQRPQRMRPCCLQRTSTHPRHTVCREYGYVYHFHNSKHPLALLKTHINLGRAQFPKDRHLCHPHFGAHSPKKTALKSV